MKKVLLALLLILILIPVILYFLLNASKPRDLGIRYSEADRKSGRQKSQIKYEKTQEKLPEAQAWQTFGKRDIDETFTQEEITAIMNNKIGAYFPYQNVQLKFNADGSGEISGALIKSRLPLYGATFAAPQPAVEFAMKFLPENPVFYLKGRASLVNNEVAIFEPQAFEIGRIPMPLGVFLSAAPKLFPEVYAMDLGEMTSQLSKLENKRALIISFINSRLSMIEGFYAEDAHFEEGKLVYQGTLPEKEVVTE